MSEAPKEKKTEGGWKQKAWGDVWGWRVGDVRDFQFANKYAMKRGVMCGTEHHREGGSKR